MSGYSELAQLGVTVRPLTDPKPPAGGRYSHFSAGLSSTVEILATELRQLDARNIVLELDLRDRDIRIDGLPRADARPSHDGVAIAFESKFGPLRYATAEFTGGWTTPAWQHNLRAIALSMQALRAVDRYGVSKRGEQYSGWRQLPMSTDAADSIATRDQALDWITSLTSDLFARDDVQGAFQKDAIREALRRTHPDTGGNPDEFRKTVRAKELIGA